MSAFEIVELTKSGGPLTKKISLSETGALISDGSACIMVAGEAKRFTFNNLTTFADVIGRLGSDKAIALGALHHELPKQVKVLTKRRIIQLNGEAPTDVVVICRTHENILYRAGKPALVLVDFDAKGMPDYVRRNIDRAGGPVLALQQRPTRTGGLRARHPCIHVRRTQPQRYGPGHPRLKRGAHLHKCRGRR